MRAIGTVSNEPDARRLESYLLSLEIVSQIDPAHDGFLVWVRDEDKVERAKQELATFLQSPADPRYDSAVDTAEGIRRQQARAEQEYRKNFRDVRSRWARPAPQNCPLTGVLIALSLVVAVLSRLGDEREPLLNHLFITRMEGNLYRPGLPEIRHGEVWRLVTPIFIHFGSLHLLFNLWNLFSIGGVIEMHRRAWRLALLVLASAFISNLAQYYYHGPNFGGMSGVLYALFGYAWMKSRYDPISGIYLPQETVTLMIAWLFLCMTGAVGPIANAAHVAGLVVGVVVGYTPVLWRKIGRR